MNDVPFDPNAPAVIIAHGHPSLSKGGGEIAAYNLFRGLRELGHRAIFLAVCPDDQRSRLYLDDPDEQAVFFDPRDYSYFYNVAVREVEDEIIHRLAAAGCGVAFFHHFYYVGLNTIRRAAAQGIPTYLTLHEYLAICHHHGQMVTRPSLHLCTRAHPAKCHACFPEFTPPHFGQRREWFLDALAGVRQFVSPSEFLKRRHIDWGLPADRVTVIENGVTAQPARRGPGTAARADRSRTHWVFGFFGQISLLKGADVFLDAASLLKAKSAGASISLRLHGRIADETLRSRIADARAAGLIDDFGPYDNADIASLVAACDYVVVPSRWWENSPLVIQEAFAAGCPVIVSAIGGLAEKVRDGVDGFHVQPGSSIDLADAIERAAREPVLTELRANLPPAADHMLMAVNYSNMVRAHSRVEPTSP